VFEYAKVNTFALAVDPANVNDAAIEKYYTAHRDSFNEESQVNLYYAKFPKVATADDEKVYYQQLIELKQKILASGNIAQSFAEEARIESDDEGSAQNGGDLGLFGHGQMVPEFDSVAFNTDSGMISDPVRTRYGYHMIFVEHKEGKDSTAKVKARHILKKIVPTIETLDLLAEKADSLKSTVTEKMSLAQAVKAFPGVEFDSTGLFKKGEMIPKIGYVSGAGRFAFTLGSKELVSERVENDDAYYLLAIKERTKKGVLPLATVKEKIATKITDSLRKAAAREYIVTAKQKLADTSSLANLKEIDQKLFSGITDTIAINGFVPGVGSNSKVAALAFISPEGKISNPVEFEGTYYIVKTLWKKNADKIDWASPEAKQISEQVKMKNMQRMYYGWYMNYKNHAKIKSNIDEIYLD